MRSVVIERTNATSSTTLVKCGSSSDTALPVCPYFLNDHGLAMICCEPFNARPLISNGAGLPSYFTSVGFGSHISMELGPPLMYRKITFFALGAKCGGFGFRS